MSPVLSTMLRPVAAAKRGNDDVCGRLASKTQARFTAYDVTMTMRVAIAADGTPARAEARGAGVMGAGGSAEELPYIRKGGRASQKPHRHADGECDRFPRDGLELERPRQHRAADETADLAAIERDEPDHVG